MAVCRGQLHDPHSCATSRRARSSRASPPAHALTHLRALCERLLEEGGRRQEAGGSSRQ